MQKMVQVKPPGTSPEEHKRGRVTAPRPGSSMHAVKALDKMRLEQFHVAYVEENTFGSLVKGGDRGEGDGRREGSTCCLDQVHARRFGGAEETDSIANEEVVKVPMGNVLSV
jgi:hypothetical protein